MLNNTAESFPPDMATKILKGEPSGWRAFFGKLICERISLATLFLIEDARCFPHKC
jgi:hypothetical protein